jgi:uncharacterized protein YbjT (DUF2867 family)
MSPPTQLLLIGAGELGRALLHHLSNLPNTQIALGIRTPSKYTQLTSPNVTPIALDIAGPSHELSRTFANYDIVISATGYGQSAGTVTKLAKEILEAGKIRKTAGKEKLWFFPWQWGVDYDIVGDGRGLMPLFGEQKQVRDLLRADAAESCVQYTILQTGIFMSFLFEQFWGIVDRQGERIKIRALRNWDHKVTVTDVDDIGKVLARIVCGDVHAENQVLYAAGDTVSYAQLADIVERITGKETERQEWSTAYLEAELAKDPDNTTKKYRLVFAKDGMWWDKELSVNHKLRLDVTDVETYARRLFGV